MLRASAYSNAKQERQHMTIYLYVKTHLITGKKYLGKTERDPYVYQGSGKRWIRHLDKHGCEIWTNILFQSDSKENIREQGRYYSDFWNIVESEEWLNLRIEDGDGGDTVSKKKWITDGMHDRYYDANLLLPEGWKYGRANCVFNDRTKQKEFSDRADKSKGGITRSKMWKDGKIKKSPEDIERLIAYCKSDDGPSKSINARKKISKAKKTWNM